ncbi:MAG: ATP-binding protein, partial [Kangiellaceae bacterium]|nr:ATP-binding protein [Kangiellaceae bacterium]
GLPPDYNVTKANVSEFYPDDVQEFAANNILKNMLEDGHWAGETYFRHFLTNEKIPVHDTHFAINDKESGQLLGYATITRDMTKEKQLESALETERTKMIQASKLATLGEMAAGIAHEINNPLSIIDGAAELLSAIVDDENARKKIAMIEKSSGRISIIVKGLKKFSRDTPNMVKSRFSVALLIKEILSLTKHSIEKNNIQIINLIPENILVYADEIQVEQVLLNLLKNAIDANKDRDKAWTEFSIESDSSQVLIIVRDSGNGIDEATLDKIFNPFYTTKQVGKGTGLGLSISKGIAQEHGGDLYYQLVEGHTAFVLQLPRVNE